LTRVKTPTPGIEPGNPCGNRLFVFLQKGARKNLGSSS